MEAERIRYRFSQSINQKLRKLQKKDNWHGIVGILVDYLFISAAIYLSLFSYWFYPLSLLIIGSRQRALATLLHESVHKTLAANRILNYLLGTFFSGSLIFQSFSFYRYSHVKRHHAFLGNEKLDPDYQYYVKDNYKEMIEDENKIVKLILMIWTYFRYLRKNRIKFFSGFNIESIIGCLYLSVLLSIFCFFGLFKYIFLFWLVPYFVTFPIVGLCIEISEHYPIVENKRIDLYMSRNRFSHWVEGFLFSIHNENYHLIHHLRPGIPFWNMKKAHKILNEDKNYREINLGMGGIFLSSNKSRSLISILMRKNRRIKSKNFGEVV